MKLKTKLAFFFSALILCALTAFLGLRCQRRQVTPDRLCGRQYYLRCRDFPYCQKLLSSQTPKSPGKTLPGQKLRRQRLYHAESGRLSLLGSILTFKKVWISSRISSCSCWGPNDGKTYNWVSCRNFYF